jgi:hypothetical protein
MKILSLLTLTLFFAACNNDTTIKTTEEKSADTTRQAQPVGNDRDEHGCIKSAGYTWSVLKNECVRLFETGLRLNPIEKTGDATLSAFVIFSTDSAKAELFLPNQEKSEVLDRRGKPGAYAWNIEDDDTKNIRRVNGEWIIEQRAKLLYKESK